MTLEGTFPYQRQDAPQLGEATTARPRHYVATALGDVDGNAATGSTAVVAGNTFYVKGAGGWTQVAGGGTNYFELMENKEFGSAATSYTFSTSVSGDVDHQYYFQYRIVKGAAGAQTTYIRPNSLTTNQRFRARYVGSTEGTINDATGGILISNNGSGSTGAAEIDSGVIWIQAATGANRTAQLEWVQSTAGPDLFRIFGGWHWTDTSTNITSWTVISTLANNIGAGSYVRLYKVKKA